MNKILLVEDEPAHAAYFREIFGDVDVCTDYGKLARAIDAGREWSAAFVDFDLSGGAAQPQPTGMSALLKLLEFRPQTRRVAYTKFEENGRTLYAVAAYRWLDTPVILHKAADGREIVAAADPRAANPTPPAWKDKLKDHAYLIDHLFARYNWLALWRIWSYYNGSIRAVADHLPPGNNPNSVRTFSEEATGAMTAFRQAFYGPRPIAYERGDPERQSRATPLVAFADANDRFLNALDLQDVLDFAKPWDRVRRI